MKRYSNRQAVLVFLLLGVYLWINSCRPSLDSSEKHILETHDKTNTEQTDRVKSQTIVLKPKGITTSNGETVDGKPPYGDNSLNTVPPKIPIPPNLRILQVMDVNLDLDLSEEQIIVVKDKNNQDSELKILVVDFDPIRNIYFKSWEAMTNAVNSHDYTLVLKDIVGDHSKQLIIEGTNEKGDLTLDVFRRTPSPNGLGLFFENICKIVSDGTIDIKEIERSEGYQLGQKNGISFPIVVFSHDPESDNVMDLVKLTYYWKYPKNSYVLSSVEKIPGKKVEEKRLKKLFDSKSIKAFEDFLKGAWYHSTKDRNMEILFFQPEEQTINLYSNNVDEVYIWKESSSKIYNRLRILVENDSISSIKKLISVRVKSLYEIYVSIQGPDRWDFSSKRYVRLPVEIEEQLVHKNETQLIKVSTIKPVGLYTNSVRGIKVEFLYPRYKWIEKDMEESGGFGIFNFGGNVDVNILQLSSLSPEGLVKSVRSFIVEYSEIKQNKELKRILKLIPVELSVNGFRTISNDIIKLTQIEYLNKEK